MALTKIGKEGITGISNSANANAITIDSGENVTLSGTLGVTGTITGTLATAAQTNITSVGTLTGFRSTGIDDNADATAITITSAERVGIGATTVDRQLHLEADNSTTYSSSDFDQAYNLLKIENNNTTNNVATGLQFLVGTNGSASITTTRTGDGAASLCFGTRGGGSRAERMRITSAGNVGIGYSNPLTKLHIRSAAASNIAGYRDGTTALIVEGDGSSYIQMVATKSAPMGILFDGGNTHNDTARGGLFYDIDYGMAFKTGGGFRWKMDEAGDLIPYNTSTGIVLGATSNVAANTLDDYEEGTWTPAIVNASNTPTFHVNTGRYTKIGRVCIVQFSQQTNQAPTFSTSSDAFKISGLPFSVYGHGYTGSQGSLSAQSFNYVGSNNTQSVGGGTGGATITPSVNSSAQMQFEVTASGAIRGKVNNGGASQGYIIEATVIYFTSD